MEKCKWIVAGIKYGSVESSRNKKYQLRNVESKIGIFALISFDDFLNDLASLVATAFSFNPNSSTCK